MFIGISGGFRGFLGSFRVHHRLVGGFQESSMMVQDEFQGVLKHFRKFQERSPRVHGASQAFESKRGFVRYKRYFSGIQKGFSRLKLLLGIHRHLRRLQGNSRRLKAFHGIPWQFKMGSWGFWRFYRPGGDFREVSASFGGIADCQLSFRVAPGESRCVSRRMLSEELQHVSGHVRRFLRVQRLSG